MGRINSRSFNNDAVRSSSSGILFYKIGANLVYYLFRAEYFS